MFWKELEVQQVFRKCSKVLLPQWSLATRRLLLFCVFYGVRTWQKLWRSRALQWWYLACFYGRLGGLSCTFRPSGIWEEAAHQESALVGPDDTPAAKTGEGSGYGQGMKCRTSDFEKVSKSIFQNFKISEVNHPNISHIQTLPIFHHSAGPSSFGFWAHLGLQGAPVKIEDFFAASGRCHLGFQLPGQVLRVLPLQVPHRPGSKATKFFLGLRGSRNFYGSR